jgi:hypothetical protein
MQSLLSKRCLRSAVVSLPSLPSLVVRLGLVPEEPDILTALPLDSLESFGAAVEEDAEAETDIVGLSDVYLDVDGLVEGFICRLSSDLHSR